MGKGRGQKWYSSLRSAAAACWQHNYLQRLCQDTLILDISAVNSSGCQSTAAVAAIVHRSGYRSTYSQL